MFDVDYSPMTSKSFNERMDFFTRQIKNKNVRFKLTYCSVLARYANFLDKDSASARIVENILAGNLEVDDDVLIEIARPYISTLRFDGVNIGADAGIFSPQTVIDFNYCYNGYNIFAFRFMEWEYDFNITTKLGPDGRADSIEMFNISLNNMPPIVHGNCNILTGVFRNLAGMPSVVHGDCWIAPAFLVNTKGIPKKCRNLVLDFRSTNQHLDEIYEISNKQIVKDWLHLLPDISLRTNHVSVIMLPAECTDIQILVSGDEVEDSLLTEEICLDCYRNIYTMTL